MALNLLRPMIVMLTIGGKKTVKKTRNRKKIEEDGRRR
jgi:hypothetical protein